ncbi:MAG: peptide-methionine (S)-S-oxide reductase [Aminivibrio sp.]|nr:peptide-methionine (S)-S-oxide reductase [Aminivibrio sp.]
MRTRVGYAGGTTADPTYDDIGDHTETVQVDYDPEKISYEQLLDVFWESHNPAARPWSVQYRSVIFTADEEQRKTAERSAARIEAAVGRVFTAVEPVSRFYMAEGYHQKYYLRRDFILMREYGDMYPERDGFVDSPSAAKVNGILAGLGSKETLEKFLPLLGLSEEGKKRLRTRVR